MIIDPHELPQAMRYKLLIGSIVPRPIAWVSTISAAGEYNLAPFSYFTIAATVPMTLIFCPQVSTATGRHKDTLRNIRSVPEFVVNITNEDTAEQMNKTATELPHGASEFTWAGVTPAPSQSIRPPRVAEAPIAFECRLQRIVTISDAPGGGSAVFGEVQLVHIREDLYDVKTGRIALDRLKPIGRLAGNSYARVNDVFDLERLAPPKPGDGRDG
ncbi:MAG: flavin reductase family protein [Anaerolineae bacterium]|nr:flavin reductase family protein [Anaerolineae bacterium]